MVLLLSKLRPIVAVLTVILLSSISYAQPADPPADDLPSGPAPWEKAGDGDTLPISRINSPQTYLDNFGIDESHFNAFIHGRPLGEDENETLFKLLYRVPHIGRERIERWREDPPNWLGVLDKPDSSRTHIYRLRGVVTGVEKVDTPPRTERAFQYDHYYRVVMKLDGAGGEPSGYSALILTRRIPEAWAIGEEVHYTAASDGLFVKVGDDSLPEPEFIFVSDRMQWYPQQSGPDVPEDWVFLARHGFDVSLFDDVRGRNMKPIDTADREAFYQLLATVATMDDAELAERANRRIDLEPLLITPKKEHGRIWMVQGRARKVTKILITDRDVRARWGLDHYYQIDVLIPLDRVIRLGKPEDETSPVYENHFPATLCVTTLPKAWAKYEDSEEAGEFIDEEIRMPAVFFKLWSYRSQYVQQFDKNDRQPSPMMIGVRPILMDPVSRAASPLVAIFAAVLFVLTVGALWYGVWRFNREPARFEILQKRHQTTQSLDDLDLDVKDGPDFSNLK